MSPQWTQDNIPDLTGKVIVITGANSGLGLECARTFARTGATVVMTARNLEKGQQAADAILQEAPQASVTVMRLDVGDLHAVREFAADFQAKYHRLDILLNNAGVMAIPRQETVDGFEMQFGVNHLGHFALTGLLLDTLLQTPQARIHNVSSTANFAGALNFDDLMSERHYSRWAAYGQSKLANVFFTFELHKRLTAAGVDTLCNVSHPGLVLGNLQANSVAQSDTPQEAFLYRLLRPLLARDITLGVQPMLYAMTAPAAKGGVLYGPRWFYHRGGPAETRANRAAYDAAALQRLWAISEDLTGVIYDALQSAGQPVKEVQYA